jgi:hypothetical protein
MTGEPHSLATLARRLERTLRDAPAAEVRLLAESQLLVTRGLVPNPAAGRRAKAAASVPGPAGYDLYVASRSPEEQAAVAATSQRISGPASGPVAWDPDRSRLRLEEGARNGHWEVLTPSGEVLTVDVRCGSPQVMAELNRLLAEIEAVMLG